MTTRHPEPIDCVYPWCTTRHSRTIHPDDEDHRSDGIGIPVLSAATGGDEYSVWEVGILRRRNDTETWIVVEEGERTVLALTLDSARRVLLSVGADPALRALLAVPAVRSWRSARS